MALIDFLKPKMDEKSEETEFSSKTKRSNISIDVSENIEIQNHQHHV